MGSKLYTVIVITVFMTGLLMPWVRIQLTPVSAELSPSEDVLILKLQNGGRTYMEKNNENTYILNQENDRHRRNDNGRFMRMADSHNRRCSASMGSYHVL